MAGAVGGVAARSGVAGTLDGGVGRAGEAGAAEARVLWPCAAWPGAARAGSACAGEAAAGGLACTGFARCARRAREVGAFFGAARSACFGSLRVGRFMERAQGAGKGAKRMIAVAWPPAGITSAEALVELVGQGLVGG